MKELVEECQLIFNECVDLGGKVEKMTEAKPKVTNLQSLMLQHMDKFKNKVDTLSQIKDVIDRNMDYIYENGAQET